MACTHEPHDRPDLATFRFFNLLAGFMSCASCRANDVVACGHTSLVIKIPLIVLICVKLPMSGETSKIRERNKETGYEKDREKNTSQHSPIPR